MTTKEKINEYHREYYAKHKEKIKEQRKKYYQNNKEMHLAKSKKWKDNNKEKVREYSREYMKQHPEIGKKCSDNFKAKHNWYEYCKEARKRRAERLKAQGITNPYAVINGAEPKYKENK